MALIKCSECGHDISSLATMCPHCGCPATQQHMHMEYVINGKNYDVSFIAEMLNNDQYIQPIIKLRDLIGITNQEATNIVDYYLEHKCLPTTVHSQELCTTMTKPNVPKCPTCGSANLTKQSVMSRGISGFLFGRHSVEGRAQFLCNNCGYQW